MSALQTDLFGLMGEGDIQSCGPEIDLISAEMDAVCESTLPKGITIIMLMQQLYLAMKL